VLQVQTSRQCSELCGFLACLCTQTGKRSVDDVDFSDILAKQEKELYIASYCYEYAFTRLNGCSPTSKKLTRVISSFLTRKSVHTVLHRRKAYFHIFKPYYTVVQKSG